MAVIYTKCCRLNGPVPQLEEPSDSTRRLAREGEEKKREPSAWEKPKLPELKAERGCP